MDDPCLEFIDRKSCRHDIGTKAQYGDRGKFGYSKYKDRVERSCTLSLAIRNSFFEIQMILLFNKPFGVLSQFTVDGSKNRNLSEFGFPKGVYPIGRLDADSEGLLLLSDEPGLNSRLLDPDHRHEREYWAQVERIPTLDALRELEQGVSIRDHKTLPCQVTLLDPPPRLSPRDPPIRVRKNVPDCWISLRLMEGKNRQVRRMTAAIGHPTLRLIRVRIAQISMGNLPVGHWRKIEAKNIF